MPSFKASILLASAAATSDVPADVLVTRQSTALTYVQNYNGDVADCTYSESASIYSAKWDRRTDSVVGLAWSTGTEFNITHSATHDTSADGSYLAVYGWINSTHAEY